MDNLEQKYKSLKRLNTALIIILCVLTAVSGALAWLGRDKLLVKLGLKEPPNGIDWSRQSWVSSMKKMDYDADVVFFGDSLTRGIDFRLKYPEVKIVEFGLSGDTIFGMKQRTAMIKAVKPEKVFLMAGINGLTDGEADISFKEYEELLEQIKAEVPEAEIYIESLLPVAANQEEDFASNSTIAEFNEKLKALAEEKGLVYVDLHSAYFKDGYINPDYTVDGVHLNPDGYNIWAEGVREYILGK